MHARLPAVHCRRLLQRCRCAQGIHDATRPPSMLPESVWRAVPHQPRTRLTEGLRTLQTELERLMTENADLKTGVKTGSRPGTPGELPPSTPPSSLHRPSALQERRDDVPHIPRAQQPGAHAKQVPSSA
jgi:hypothetical protein